MTNYIATSVNLSPIQKQKIASAVRSKKGITIHLSANDYRGNDKIRLTTQQINKIRKAQSKNVGVDLKLSKTQLSKQGGFIGALLGGLAASVLPQLIGTVTKLFGSGIVLPGTVPRTHNQGGNVSKKNKKIAKGLILPGTLRSPPFIGTY